MTYDPQNIFAKILRGEIPSNRVYEDEFALAFHDINPQAPVHVLVIPKGSYTCWRDFADRATDAEIAGLTRAVQKTALALGISDDGYRVISNAGPNSMQEVPHLHIHILAGTKLGTRIACIDQLD